MQASPLVPGRRMGRLRTRQRPDMQAFTVVELVVVVVVLGILVTLVVVAYAGIQKRSADAVVQNTVSDALKNLQLYNSENRKYPSNLADTDYVPPLTVATQLYTDAPQLPTYQNLTSEQNAQLFLNSCNGYMPIISGGQTYNSPFTFSGKNVHIKGQASSNVIINGPTISQASFVLPCGVDCTTAQTNIINMFLSQGGGFPITVPKSSSALPSPTMVNTGLATQFCVEVRAGQYNDVVYHASSGVELIEQGACPANGALHYP